MQSIKLFSNLTKFQTGIISLLANLTASEEDLEKLKQVFEKLDHDQKGFLTIDKIKKGIEELMHMNQEDDKEESKAGEKKTKKKLACTHPPDEYERMMQGMDRNGDGKITWDEFVTAAIDKIALLNKANIEAAFKVLDKDGNGKVTKEELKANFGSSDKKDQEEADKDDSMWEEIMRQVDLDACGNITFKEFKDNMNKVLKVKIGSIHGQAK